MKTKILSLFFLCALFSIGTVKAQTELITNGGFEADPTTYTVTNALKRVATIYDATNATSNPTATGDAIIAGQWYKLAGNDVTTATIVSSDKKSGTYSLNLKIATGLASTTVNYTKWYSLAISQKLASNLNNSKKYIVTFWAKQDASSSNKATTIFCLLGDNGLKAVASPFAQPVALNASSYTTWTKYTVMMDLAEYKSIYGAATIDFSTGSYLGFAITTTGTAITTTGNAGVLIDDISISEYSETPSVRYVKSGGTGDGTSWATASGDIIAMINDIPAGEIRVAAGTYSPGMNIPLRDGVDLLGGYPSNATIGNETRDLANNQTILDGALNKKLLSTNELTPFCRSTVDGFIIQRGQNSYGSAAFLGHGNVIQNSIFRNNNGNGTSIGGTIFFKKSGFTSTTALSPVQYGSIAIINSLIVNNSTTKQAGAIVIDAGAITLTNCVIANNKCTDASQSAGGILFGAYSRDSRIVNNIFYGNTCTFNSLYNNIGNTASGTNRGPLSAFYNNYLDDAAIPTVPVVTNFTTNNKYRTDFAASTIFVGANSISGYSADAGEITTINNSDWRLKAASGCIDAGISSTNADLPYPFIYTEGANRAYSTINKDIVGNDRINSTAPDMGAYEYYLPVTVTTAAGTGGSVSATTTVNKGTSVTVTATALSGYAFKNWTDGTNTITSNPYTFVPTADITLTAVFDVPIRYVTVTGAGDYNGTSWANAAVGTATAIQAQIDAVNAIPGRGEIRFGAGTYELLATLTLKDGASLIGGYPANPVTGSNDTRDLLNNQTIFDGGDSRKLMTAPDAEGIIYTHITLIDGFILQRGNSSYGSAASLCYGFVMQNCIIRNNKYTGTGGAGGAVYVVRNSFNPGGANPTTTGGAFINCVFANNSTSKGASALLLSGNANSTITNCVFANNVTSDATDIKIRNTNNFGRYGAVNVGGANGLLRVVNNIFYRNSGSNSVDRHLNDTYTYFGALYNNYFDGSAAWRDSVALTLADYNTPVLESAGYYKNFTANSNKCNADFAASSIFTAPNAILGSATTQEEIDAINNSDWRLKAGSGCISAGISSSNADITYPYSIMLGSNRAYSTITTDLSGSARINDAVDMGAYEYGLTTSGNTVTIANGAAIGSLLSLDGTKDVVVNKGGTLSIDAATTLSSLTINAGGSVTLASGQTLAPGTLTLQSNTNGTATFVDNNTYVDQTAAPDVTATVQQHLTAGRNWYVASPISDGVRADLSTATTVVSYDESIADWATESGSLNPLKGYISTNTTGTSAVSFGGVLNNGPLSVTLSRHALLTNGVTANPKPGFNLVGNPYPSYLDWSLATKTNLETTAWFRTKTVGASSTYTFDTYNATNNTGTNNNLGGAVTKFIPPMQAFWVRVAAGQTTGTYGVDNNMRTHEAGTNRLKAKGESKSSQQLLRLKVSNGTNSDEAIVLFNPNASDSFDAYDSHKMTNANAAIPEICTTVGSEQLVINGLSRVVFNQPITLVFAPGAANKNFSIKATEFSNFGNDTRIILRDNQIASEQDITDGTPYNFESDAVKTANRFSLIFKISGVTTGLENAINAKLSMFVYRNANNQLVINREVLSSQEGTITVSNTMGQKIMSSRTNGAISVLPVSFTSGVYFVTVQVDGKQATQKFIID